MSRSASKQPWERLPEETDRDWGAFVTYLFTPCQDRAERGNRGRAQRHHWADRASAYDLAHAPERPEVTHARTERIALSELTARCCLSGLTPKQCAEMPIASKLRIGLQALAQARLEYLDARTDAAPDSDADDFDPAVLTPEQLEVWLALLHTGRGTPRLDERERLAAHGLGTESPPTLSDAGPTAADAIC